MTAGFDEGRREEVDEEARAGQFALVAVAWRRKRLIALVTVLCVLTAVLLSLRQTKQYESTASLLFRDPGFARTLYGNDLFDAGGDPQRATQTNIDVVGSPSVGRFVQSRLRSEESVGSLVDSVTVEPSSDSDVATVTARREDPEDAARVANAFARGYIDYRRTTDQRTVRLAEELIGRSLQAAPAETRPGLLDSQRRLEVLRTLQTGNAEVVAQAEANASPVSPRPKRNALFGAMLGLLAGFGLALLVDLLDRRLPRDEDVEAAYPDYPLLTTIPNDRAGNEAVAVAGRTGEAYRMLRESLRFADPDREARCIVVTSADEGEGKSTVARHLAVLLASTGQDVVLVEADMRRPTIARLLGMDSRSLGLSNVLTTQMEVRHVLLRPLEDIPTLMVLPAGAVPPRPADLLRQGSVNGVLEQLREMGDVVIIDSPPLLPVADTRALLQSSGVDGVLMVGRVGATRRDQAHEAKRVLAQSGKRVIGLVVTAGKQTERSSYYDEPGETRSRWATLTGG